MAEPTTRPRRRLPRPTPVVAPRLAERQYVATLRRLFFDRLIEAIRQQLLPRLPGLVEDARSRRPHIRRDAWPEEVEALRQQMDFGFQDLDAEVGVRAQDMAVTLNESNRTQWARAMRGTIGVDIVASEPWLREQMLGFTRQNVTLIRKLKEQSLDEIEGVVQRGLQSGLRVEQIRENILDRVGVSRSRAQLIARDQVAKFSGQLSELRQTNIGVSQYRWRTARDERVRTTHRRMSGKLCVWDDSTVFILKGERVSRSSIGGVELHPGQDFQCRCYPEPVLTEILEAF